MSSCFANTQQILLYPPQKYLASATLTIWHLSMQEINKELFAIFKQFFEDGSIKKVWHNYSFDRHVLRNHGIDCQGFAADTMHMARLWDSSRQGKGYSLESLTGYELCCAHRASRPPQATCKRIGDNF